eukprot:365731-Chlamydomonas_euryale.AAC.6
MHAIGPCVCDLNVIQTRKAESHTLCKRSFSPGRHPGASWRILAQNGQPINAHVLSVLRIPGVLRSFYERPENVALLGCGWDAAGMQLGRAG